MASAIPEMVFASVGLFTAWLSLVFSLLSPFYTTLFISPIYSSLLPDSYHRALEFSLLLQAFMPFIAWIRIYA